MNLSLGPRMNWLWLFPAIGVAALVIACVVLAARLRFESTALRADGVVTAMVRTVSTDSDGHRSELWCPDVRFADRGGVVHAHSSTACSRPPAYRVGDHVTVLYPDGQPERARLDGFIERWLAFLVVGGIGAVFSAIGLALVLPTLARRKRAAELRVSGRPVMARVTDVSLNSGLKINGRSPWRIRAQWQDGVQGRLYLFESDDLWFDPSPYLAAEIRVLIDPANPKRYWVDTGALPELA